MQESDSSCHKAQEVFEVSTSKEDVDLPHKNPNLIDEAAHNYRFKPPFRGYMHHTISQVSVIALSSTFTLHLHPPLLLGTGNSCLLLESLAGHSI